MPLFRKKSREIFRIFKIRRIFGKYFSMNCNAVFLNVLQADALEESCAECLLCKKKKCCKKYKKSKRCKDCPKG